MFDLIVNAHRDTARRGLAPLVISWTVHALVVGAVVLLPLLFATIHSRLPPRSSSYSGGTARGHRLLPHPRPRRTGCEAEFASVCTDPAASAASTGGGPSRASARHRHGG